MNTYTTSEVAKIIGIHPNTVRLYEEWGLIPKAERKANGYRVFTDFHIEQFRLARTAFQIEVLQNGLRKKIVETVKVSAKKDFDQALVLANEYLSQIQKEERNAEEAIAITRQILEGKAISETPPLCLKRKEVDGRAILWRKRPLLLVHFYRAVRFVTIYGLLGYHNR